MSSLLKVWEKIVAESEEAQIAEGEKKGLVKNFLLDDVYLRESAFAAKIFATEYIRTCDEKFLQKAKMALDALQKIFNEKDMTQGLEEPTWTPRGIRLRKGSIPATIILLYAIDETTKLIDYKFIYNIKAILDYLALCYLGNGKFYHDKVDRNNKGHKFHVVNTTAMSYLFLQMAKSKDITNSFYRQEIKKIEKAIKRSQRADGFWSYFEPNIFQKFLWFFSPMIPDIVLKIYNKIMEDRSIFFGDALHHVVSIYYFLAAKNEVASTLGHGEKEMLTRGWSFIKNDLKERCDKEIYFDFSWEPKPKSLRYCNFIDTSTYFYILNLLRLLVKYTIVTENEREHYTNGIVNHIAKNLMSNTTPSIRAYEGSMDIIQNIIPRPSESIFDKGFLISSLVLDSIGSDYPL
ncbi:MAG: hypothetical protein A4E66_00345 [Syntrophus sp. PtaB.Bin001]|nr:MAG: hypothetical protein A4E66_00345 [Syntrophus sp. PtaB.Bin001]